ncbi:MAG: hypothetical protein ABFS18_12320, partial [Thermodesulfobacteriota bacterium]
RQLSLLAPMVLHGRLCGRVGRCRIFFLNAFILYRMKAFFLPDAVFSDWGVEFVGRSWFYE